MFRSSLSPAQRPESTCPNNKVKTPIDDEHATYTPDEPTASVLAHTSIDARAEVTAETKLPRHQAGQALTSSSYVELRGFEPLTSSMPWKRATNCAIAPNRRPPLTRRLP